MCKISTSMFSTIDKIFYDNHLISTDCSYNLSLHNQISTPTNTSLQHLKSGLPAKKT